MEKAIQFVNPVSEIFPFSKFLNEFSLYPDEPFIAAKNIDYEISEKEDGKFKITLSVPGFSKDDLKIEASGNELTVSGKLKKENVPGFVKKEFKKTWKFDDLDADNVEATLENGILEITVGTKKEIKTINIK